MDVVGEQDNTEGDQVFCSATAGRRTQKKLNKPPCLSFILFLLLSYSLPFLKRCALPKAYQSPWLLPLLLSYTPEAYSFSYHLCLPYPLSLLAFPPQAHGHHVRSHTFTLTLSFPPQPKAGKGALLSSHAPSPHFLFAPRLRVTWLLSPLPHSVCSGWPTNVLAIKPNAQFSNLIYLGLSGMFDYWAHPQGLLFVRATDT